MSAALVIVRVGLAAAFGLAGVAKLCDRSGTREALGAFGLPDRAMGAAVWLLPFAELVIAVALLPGRTAQSAAVCAFVLLALFSAGIVRTLVRGERVRCRCFGPLSDAPIGRVSLTRNAALMALAGFAAFAAHAPGPGIEVWLGARSEAGLVAFWLGLVLAAVVTAGAWFGRELLRQQGRLMLRLDALEGATPPRAGLPVGAPAPRFEIQAWGAGVLSLDGLLAGELPVGLVFSDPQCGPCGAAVPLVAGAQRDLAGLMTISVVSSDSSPQSESAWREHQLERVGIAAGHDVALSFGIVGSPAAVIVAPDGRIASGPALGLEQVMELLRAPLGDEDGGIDLPPIELSMAGKEVLGHVAAS